MPQRVRQRAEGVQQDDEAPRLVAVHGLAQVRDDVREVGQEPWAGLLLVGGKGRARRLLHALVPVEHGAEDALDQREEEGGVVVAGQDPARVAAEGPHHGAAELGAGLEGARVVELLEEEGEELRQVLVHPLHARRDGAQRQDARLAVPDVPVLELLAQQGEKDGQQHLGPEELGHAVERGGAAPAEVPLLHGAPASAPTSSPQAAPAPALVVVVPLLLLVHPAAPPARVHGLKVLGAVGHRVQLLLGVRLHHLPVPLRKDHAPQEHGHEARQERPKHLGDALPPPPMLLLLLLLPVAARPPRRRLQLQILVPVELEEDAPELAGLPRHLLLRVLRLGQHKVHDLAQLLQQRVHPLPEQRHERLAHPAAHARVRVVLEHGEALDEGLHGHRQLRRLERHQEVHAPDRRRSQGRVVVAEEGGERGHQAVQHLGPVAALVAAQRVARVLQDLGDGPQGALHGLGCAKVEVRTDWCLEASDRVTEDDSPRPARCPACRGAPGRAPARPAPAGGPTARCASPAW